MKYNGPKKRKIRRFGNLPYFTGKVISKNTKTPGVHGKPLLFSKKSYSIADNYRIKLQEKQKLCLNYGISNKQLLNYFKKLRKYKEQSLFAFLEMRLDSILVRSSFFSTIFAAKQAINHGHIFVNDKKVTFSSYLCTIGDKITCKMKKLLKNKINTNSIRLPQHLKSDFEQNKIDVLAMIKKEDIPFIIDEYKVFEFYSKFS